MTQVFKYILTYTRTVEPHERIAYASPSVDENVIALGNLSKLVHLVICEDLVEVNVP